MKKSPNCRNGPIKTNRITRMPYTCEYSATIARGAPYTEILFHTLRRQGKLFPFPPDPAGFLPFRSGKHCGGDLMNLYFLTVTYILNQFIEKKTLALYINLYILFTSQFHTN